MRILLLMLMPVFCMAQNSLISFGVKADTSGGVYFIRQIVTRNADTTLTTASAIRFEKADDAILTIEKIISAVQKDSAEIQRIYRNVMRQLAELNAAKLMLRPEQTPKQPEQLTPEQEIARLREENERLKKQSETGKKQ